jgi:diguanylate cyclase (GGDEF)-like protein
MNLAPQFSLDDAAQERPPQVQATGGLRSWFARANEPYILLSALTVLLLSLSWATVFNLIGVERRNAETAAAAASVELLHTYRSEVVRTLREIDQTLRVVKYVYETRGSAAGLSELQARALLPPNLIFIVRVVNRNGDIVASTRPDQPLPSADRGYLSILRRSDTLWVDEPRSNPASNDWTLQFGRSLVSVDGEFAGAVLLEVDASYFVSGYDAALLGNNGVLAVLGTDGVFRAKRTGGKMQAGDRVNYSTVVPAGNDADPTASVSSNIWDGVRRYTTVQQLYEFPLAVVVGLSEEERLATVRSNGRSYLWQVSIGSVVMICLTVLLGRLSWQLALSRVRESDAKVMHAQRVEYLVYHDGLTGLPNRSLFNKLLSQAVAQAQRHGRQLAVAFIDLDRFKQINDTLGHEAGDELLKEAATRLTASLRSSDIVARLGGDEFVVLLTDLQLERYAATVAQKIITAIAAPFVLLGHEFRVTASIGISTYPRDGSDEQTLSKNADIAMYQAKEDGKNNYQFYSPKLNANSLERLTFESSLRHALERREFQLHYQPKRDMTSGRITGVEALLRWQHPDLGTVAPMRFIPLAEETGLIVPIGKWVLHTACEQNVAWQKQGLPRLSIAINLTARQFDDESLLSDIAAALEATGMEAALLEIEIHESLLIRDVGRALRILSALKALGVRIAIDDFGTGYSSLSTLHRFPLDTVKIDRSFIRNVAAQTDNSELTEAIIAMGKNLSLTVVAQGVETKEQADFLRQHACDELQGFYFNKPMPAAEFTTLLGAQTQG